VKIIRWLKSFYEDFKAWRRKEKRVAPRAVRGRVYQRKEGSDIGVPDTVVKIKKEPVATLTMKVTREDGSTEIIKVPAQVTQHG
jgi:hypothetical protein